jgi:hypothetical protein
VGKDEGVNENVYFFTMSQITNVDSIATSEAHLKQYNLKHFPP